MQITVKETDMKVENGRLIINIDSDLEKLLGINKVVISSVKPGQVIKSAIGIEYIVLEHLDNGSTRIIRKDLLPERMKFDDDNNNFSSSSLNKYLNDNYYREEVIPGFGDGTVVVHNVNLLSLDGLDDYGTYDTKVGLLTIDDYRRYRKNCLKENMDSWWWLSTPDSTPSGYGSDCVRYVCGDGCVDYNDYNNWNKSVRPALRWKTKQSRRNAEIRVPSSKNFQ